MSQVDEAAYRSLMSVWSAWARRRHRDDFARVERFCLFVGYPRSGHSIIGAFLNAHPDAVVSHELDVAPLVLGGCSRDDLYARILARAGWFNLRGNQSNYSYRVPGQWQGRFRTLRVIGDKRGGAITRSIAEHPDFLERVRSLIGVPLRLIHVVRNPFDNIAAIAIWHGLSLEESIAFYFAHCRTTARLGELCAAGELITLRHEDMIRSPAAQLTALFGFLELGIESGHLAACCRTMFPAPTCSRQRLTWSPALVREVEQRSRAHHWLDGYGFEIAGVPPASSASVQAGEPTRRAAS